MTRYEKLLVKAEKVGIKVKEVDFGDYEECGYYCNNKILINTRLNEKQKHGVLAEELGHHYKTHGDISDQTKIENRKKELIARRYGYKFILEPLDIVYAMKSGCTNMYEIADFYELTIEEMINIMNDFKRQYGIGRRFNGYFIAFEPTFAFIKMPSNENVS